MAFPPEDVAALSQLFDAGEAIAPFGREAWLATLPPEQRHLAPMLREMLAARMPDSSFWPLPELAVDGGALEGAGTRVGPYRLIRQIGDGGMGSVWLAERVDGSFERRVALKLPRLPLLTRGLPERMARERQIGARLEHPNIARLYDAGVDTAQQPYIAFEYVDGKPVDQWCREQACSAQQTLRVFVQVIRALAYAHRQLVVHRDVKPANILVDADGRAFLLDFGIAKLLEEVAGPNSSVTREFGTAMTRRYASPEQIAGLPVGTASDVYSTGVALYEVLTGTSPYGPAPETVRGLDEAILRGDIPPASSRVCDPRLRRQLRGDLDALLWKALQRRPEQRFHGADAMADDIERFLAGEPIAIRHAPWFERGRRYAVRHRAGLLVMMIVGVAVSIVLGVFVQQTRRTAEETERARMVTEFTEGLFRLQALPARVSPHATGTGLQALDPVLTLINLRFAGRPDVQADLYGAIARVYTELEVGNLAAELAGRQVDVLRRAGVPAARLAPALLLLATADQRRGHYADAQKHAREAVAALPDIASEAGLGARAALAALLLPSGGASEARAIFAAVEAAVPLDERPHSLALARFLDARGVLLEIDNRFDEALALWRRAVAVATEVEGLDSRTAATIRLRVAAESLARNRSKDAHDNFELAVAALNNLGNSGKVQAAVAASKYAMDAFSMGLMSHAEAAALLDSAHGTVAAWGPALPAQVLAKIDVSRGVLALRHQDLGAAADLLERAVPVARRATDAVIDLRWFTVYLAALAMATGQHDRADTLLRERIELRVKAGDGATSFAAYDWVQLSHNAVMKGDLAAAKATLQRAPVFKALEGDLHASGKAYANASAEQWARIRLREGDPAGALAVLPDPYGLEPVEDRSEPTLAPHALRGEVLCAAGHPAQGLPYLLASIQSIEPVLNPAAPALARLRAVAGRCALDAGDRAAAAQMARLARAAFTMQARVSDWYRLPLADLERALNARATPGSQAPHVLIKAAAASGAA